LKLSAIPKEMLLKNQLTSNLTVLMNATPLFHSNTKLVAQLSQSHHGLHSYKLTHGSLESSYLFSELLLHHTE